MSRRILPSLLFLMLVIPSGALVADGADSRADLPGGFGDILKQSRGVIIRVPIGTNGQENTNAAELRFYGKDESVSKTSNPGRLWSMSVDPGRSPEVLGTRAPQDSDSSTWYWYNWYNLGWVYPYYYTYYYPTFYWSNYYWYYSYYWNWSWFGYRYYYYYYWW